MDSIYIYTYTHTYTYLFVFFVPLFVRLLTCSIFCLFVRLVLFSIVVVLVPLLFDDRCSDKSENLDEKFAGITNSISFCACF